MMYSHTGHAIRLNCMVCMFAIFFASIFPVLSHADADWSIYRTLKLESPPVDVAVSLNGKWIFVLTDQGQMHIFSNGNLVEKINVGNHVDQIDVGPREELLLLTSKRNQTIQVLAIDFVKDIDVSGAPFKGVEEAPVTIAVFSDYQCEYCKALLTVVDQVLDLYPKEVKIVFKNFPLKRNSFSTTAATAALAAHKQGMFWEFHDLLFENAAHLSDLSIKEIATELGLDQEIFQKDMNDPEIISRVRKDFQDGRNAGVRSVPTIFVNGKRLKRKNLAGFQTLIDSELKKQENRP